MNPRVRLAAGSRVATPLSFLVTALWMLLATALPSRAAVVYAQPHDGTGAFYQSSWWDPDGSDYDQLTWDSFILSSAAAITEVRWRGGFDPSHFGMGGPVVDFTVAVYGDIANGYQPDILSRPLASYDVGGNAGQSPAGVFGGVTMYDYSFRLPSPFQAAANTHYWVLIEAWQHGIPDWGIALGAGGNGKCFRRTAGVGDFRYYLAGGDVALTLLNDGAQSFPVTVTVLPDGAGTVVGAGEYPAGSQVSLTASPAAGFAFQGWTEAGVAAGSNPVLTFTANGPRDLVANFVPAYAITVASMPVFGGQATGGGTFGEGATVMLDAAPQPGFVFSGWMEGGAVVSEVPHYAFTAAGARVVFAWFVPDGNTVVFDLDSGAPLLSPGMALPLEQTVEGITAAFRAPVPGGGFFLQTDAQTFYRLSGFTGNYLMPSSLSGSLLEIRFDEPVTGVRLSYATTDFQQADVPSTVRIRAYSGSTATPPVAVALAHAAYLGDTMPMGIFGVAAAVPFEVVWIDIPPSPTAASGILVDNLVVTRVPRLSIAPAPAGGVRVSWPDPSGGYLLESSPSVAPVSWVPEPGAIETSGGLRIQTVPAGSGPRFFRLRRP